VARALIVGCGCRGRLLGSELLESGWAVRGTSRREEGLEAIADAGIEPARVDPTRPGTVLDQIADVTALVWLLASAQGRDEELTAIHGSGLQRVLERLVETPVRRFVYEAGGTAHPALLQQGEEIAREAEQRWRIPVVAPKTVRLTDIAKLG
jgi:nucleoside-diphosphate-sugar epimerase